MSAEICWQDGKFVVSTLASFFEDSVDQHAVFCHRLMFKDSFSRVIAAELLEAQAECSIRFPESNIARLEPKKIECLISVQKPVLDQ